MLVILAALTAATAAPADEPARLLHLADVSDDQIVFTYEADLWTVDRDGGTARRLTLGHGAERHAKFSPDGQWIAFTGQYDGFDDVYVMPAAGGEPRRLTFHPGRDQVIDWHPDGRHVLFRSSRAHPLGEPEFFLVPVDGGLPERVPTDRGALASYEAGGERLVYNRIPRETRTWKRYQGGMAQDLWLADLASGEFTRLTSWTGTDNYPMWIGDRVYFASDREDGTLNLYALDPDRPEAAPTRLTSFTEYDVKYPSAGPDVIVFQHEELLHLLDTATGEVRPVPVQVRSDRVPMRPELVGIEPRSGSFGLEPGGERLLLEARGEILDVPVEEGRWRNLTGTSGSREKNAAWSPDGSQIALVSDRTGDEQVHLVPAGGGAWRQLTDGEFGMILPPVWSPDGKWLLFGDKFMRLNLVEVSSGKRTVVDQGEYDDAWERWGILDSVWSPDSRWIAYTKNTGNMHEVITLYDRERGERHPVTDAMFTSWSPSFSPDGRYLWFLSNRSFEPIMGRVDQNHVFLDVARPYLVLLQDGVRSPFDPAYDAPGGEDAGDDDDELRVEIDPDDLARRTVPAVGCPAANWFRLEAVDDGCLLLRRDEPTFLKYQNVDDRTTDTDLTLVHYALEDEATTDLGGGVTNYHLAPGGETVVVRKGAGYVVAPVGGKLADADAVDLSDVRIRVDRDAEYRQIFAEAWRIQRDWFYDPGMHGEDWAAVREKYARFLPWAGHRDDLRYLIGEMIGELNIGHTYVYGGDYQGGPTRIGTGLLGCDLTLDPESGRYRLARILPSWAHFDGPVSPLAAPGVGVREGAYLLAIDGIELRAEDNPYAALVDRAGDLVTLTVADGPRDDGREVRVEALRSEGGLRYRTWVEGNRAAVLEMSGGRVGYLHLPNMMQPGLVEFARSWFPQTGMEAMVIDERYNGGGFVGDMIIDRLERELWSLTIPREGRAGRNPERAFHGPLAVLINEDTGSNGEFFAQAIKEKDLARVIGMRTWGGSIGIEPHQDLVDAGVTTPPQFGLYGLATGDWLIEGWGVEPHDVVQNLPGAVLAGEDTQLEFAVRYLLEQLEEHGERWAIPPVPAYPDKSRPRMSGVNR
jgi:tricorn protease